MIDARHLVGNASDAAFAIDGGLRIVAWNYRARRLLMLWTAPATGITMCQSAVAVNRQEGAVL
ncbi:MAG: hypothetical protein QF797_10125 [Alphaproteobacteria bacterium]|jgi:D-mannonate dehydratase|nr:hypothetical protein [Rhodospirillaceae bacterium]MDP6405554.1 hypothetical protein [Alphaproteobacteria bacterium]MDP6624534.1 hypothetical protein [Alphaproteobacteria bacterium]